MQIQPDFLFLFFIPTVPAFSSVENWASCIYVCNSLYPVSRQSNTENIYLLNKYESVNFSKLPIVKVNSFNDVIDCKTLKKKNSVHTDK